MTNDERIEQIRKKMIEIILKFKQERIKMNDPIIYLEEIQSKLNIDDENFIYALDAWDEICFVPIKSRKNNNKKTYIFNQIINGKMKTERYFALYWV